MHAGCGRPAAVSSLVCERPSKTAISLNLNSPSLESISRYRCSLPDGTDARQFSKQTDCGNCEASPTDSLLVVARPRPLDYGWQKAWAEQCGECILLIRAVARATRHSSPRADNRVPCPAFRWFSGRGEENSLADPVSF